MFPVFARVIKPAYLQVRYISSLLQDLRLGITTTEERVARELGHDFDRYRHRAVAFMGLKRLMRHLDPDPSDALLDLGCGAGRIICVAAQHPFSRVIGIDIDEEFCALAERNARALRRCSIRPEVVCTDAAMYRVPDNATVVVLYNSFGGEVLRAALTRVLESFDRAPRRIRIAYANPREHDLVISMERFRETGRLWVSWRPGRQWRRTQLMRVYEVEPQGLTKRMGNESRVQATD
jgi:predicted RNA methylase